MKENKNSVQEALDKYRKTKKAYVDPDEDLDFFNLMPMPKEKSENKSKNKNQ